MVCGPLQGIQIEGLRDTEWFMRSLTTVASLKSMIVTRIVPKINLVSLHGVGLRRFARFQCTQFEFFWLVTLINGLRAFDVGALVFVGLCGLTVGCRWLWRRRSPRASKFGSNIERVFGRDLCCPVWGIHVVVVVAHFHQTASNLYFNWYYNLLD